MLFRSLSSTLFSHSLLYIFTSNMSVTRVVESSVIPAPLETVWNTVRPCDLKFWSLVKSTTIENGKSAAEVGSLRVVTFKDGTVQKLKLLELSDLDFTATYDVIESNPPVSVLSTIHTIKLKRVTSDNSTFVEWSGDYSSDCTQAVIQDSAYKKKDGLKDLATAVSGSKK